MRFWRRIQKPRGEPRRASEIRSARVSKCFGETRLDKSRIRIVSAYARAWHDGGFLRDGIPPNIVVATGYLQFKSVNFQDTSKN